MSKGSFLPQTELALPVWKVDVVAVTVKGCLKVCQGLAGIKFRLVWVCLPMADLLGKVQWIGFEGVSAHYDHG